MGHLFIINSEGREEKTAKQICDLFNVDLNKVLKNPQFKNNKRHKGKNYLGSRAGKHIIPYFRTKHPETGVEVEVRYAESWEADKQNKNIYKYLPQRVEFSGEVFRKDTDQELAVWFYLNSLLRKNKPEYEFLDTVKIAQEQIKNVDDIEAALVLSRTITDDQLTVVLKGLARHFKSFDGNVDNMDLIEQRAAFRNMALQNPTLFVQRVQKSALAKVEGTILQLVDKGGIALLPDGPFKIWKWTAGPKLGQSIGATIKEHSADTKSLLISEILANPDEYKEALTQTLERVYADSIASQNADAWGGFSIEEATSGVREVISKSDFATNTKQAVTNVVTATMKTPRADMDAVRKFCEQWGFKKDMKDVASMKRAIEDGVVNDDTILLWTEKNMKKVN